MTIRSHDYSINSDQMVTGEESERDANLLPNGDFQLLEATPHPLEKVDMALLAERIRSFLA